VRPLPEDLEITTGPGVVRVAGELDLQNVEDVRGAVEALAAEQSGPVLLDLGGVTFVDSTGIRLLVELTVASRRDGDRLRIAPSDAVSDVLRLCGLEGRLPMDA
jgi:anti-sigma B factor antagonist